MPAIEARALYKVFGAHPERALARLKQGVHRDEVHKETGQLGAVNDASFAVEPGELFVVMGLSGSGKSTLVRMINHLHEPTDGQVLIDGTDLASLSHDKLRKLRNQKISMVFQSFGLFPHRTVLENVAYGLEIAKIDKSERRERAQKAITQVGLEGWEARPPSALSGGMRQRVGLARALATNADVLLMDEPFSALDPLIRRDMQQQLLQLQHELQKTIVFITHDLNEAMLLGDRIAVMKDGYIVQDDTPEGILTRPANDYVAEFIADVDRSRVLTADAVMQEPVQTLSPGHAPRVGLMEMRSISAAALYVVGRGRQLHGVVTDTALADAERRGVERVGEVVSHDHPLARTDTLLGNLLEEAALSEIPTAVVDDQQRLVGVIPRAALLSVLSTKDEPHPSGDRGEEGTADITERPADAATGGEVAQDV